MMRTILLILLLAPVLLIAQVKNDSGTPIDGELHITDYMCGVYGGLFNKKRDLVILEISCASSLAKRAHYAVIDLNKMKLVCQFAMRKWSYFHESYFYEDSVLYLSFGKPLSTKYMVFDITNGRLKTKVKGKFSPYGINYYSKDLYILPIDNYRDVVIPFKGSNYIFTYADKKLRWIKKKKK